MVILLAAVAAETALLRQGLAADGADRWRGPLGAMEALLLHGGVGKTATALALTRLLERTAAEAVLQLGIGGAYPGSGLAVGDLAAATEELAADEGSQTPAGFLDLEALGLPSLTVSGKRLYHRFPCDGALARGISSRLGAWALATGFRFAAGPFATVSCCSGTDALAQERASRTGALVESMEGAAAAQVCAAYGVPFAEIRAISNLAEDRNPRRWNIPLAAERAQQAVLHLLAPGTGLWNAE